MKISYAITVCDEFHEVARLLDQLLSQKREQDEVVVLLDTTESNPLVKLVLLDKEITHGVRVIAGKFDGHFANWKNRLTEHCTGDYIFQIDADEYPDNNLIAALPQIIEEHPTVEVYRVPRINTVEGITPQHIAKWGWIVSPEGWINFPDSQWRIYKNAKHIRWVNKVHERLEGFNVLAELPAVREYCLYHPKTIEKQEKQNQLYDTLMQ